MTIQQPAVTPERRTGAIVALVVAIIAAVFVVFLLIVAGLSLEPGNGDLGWLALRLTVSGLIPFLAAIVVALVLGIVSLRSINPSSKRLGKAALIIDGSSVVVLVVFALTLLH
jgi:uncharacterized membrane protein